MNGGITRVRVGAAERAITVEQARLWAGGPGKEVGVVVDGVHGDVAPEHSGVDGRRQQRGGDSGADHAGRVVVDEADGDADGRGECKEEVEPHGVDVAAAAHLVRGPLAGAVLLEADGGAKDDHDRRADRGAHQHGKGPGLHACVRRRVAASGGGVAGRVVRVAWAVGGAGGGFFTAMPAAERRCEAGVTHLPVTGAPAQVWRRSGAGVAQAAAVLALDMQGQVCSVRDGRQEVPELVLSAYPGLSWKCAAVTVRGGHMREGGAHDEAEAGEAPIVDVHAKRDGEHGAHQRRHEHAGDDDDGVVAGETEAGEAAGDDEQREVVKGELCIGTDSVDQLLQPQLTDDALPGLSVLGVHCTSAKLSAPTIWLQAPGTAPSTCYPYPPGRCIGDRPAFVRAPGAAQCCGCSGARRGACRHRAGARMSDCLALVAMHGQEGLL